ncbi:serine hydrolase [Candidatus Saccharibacteria bacterium]|nr:serine hydrolase [Candidatus Saccharibacteria bacterium]
MVHRKISQRKAVEEPLGDISMPNASPIRRRDYALLLVCILLAVAFLVVLLLKISNLGQKDTVNEDLTNEGSASESSDNLGYEDNNDGADNSSDSVDLDKELPPAIELKSVVEAWAGGVSGNKSVAIYDLDRKEWAVRYNSTESYNTASLYKLFVVYEGYRLIQDGVWQADTPAGSTGYTILKCLDLAIRESHSACAETLWAKIGSDKLDNIIYGEWGIRGSDISGLVSNAEDITRIMRRFYQHPDITDSNLLAKMWDSFLNQPTTEYNWRQGLPSGFSSAVDVYNKVGWDYNADDKYWNIYHDSAIVHFKDLDRTFVLVVMTNRVDYHKIRELGTMIESAVKNAS